MQKFDLDEIRSAAGRRGTDRKDPLMTFIGGIVIGLVLGGIIGAAIMGHHIMAVLGI